MTTPTPTPWIAEVDLAPRWVITNGPKSLAVTVGGNDEANARHIVHCVNVHDELIAALQLILSAKGDCAKAGFTVEDIARAALAKAEGSES